MSDTQRKPQNPKFPEKMYSGMSVEEFIKAFPHLTEAQKVTLRKQREKGELY